MGGFSLCLAGRFFALWGVFFLSVCVNICGDTFGGSKAIFGGSPLVFFVRCCGLCVAFVCGIVSNASNFACMGFCGCG